MLTFSKFTGINNVLPSHRLVPDRKTGASALVTATNVDVGLDGELSRRAGYSEVLDTCHKNLWQANGFMLATVDGGDLVAIAPNGARTTIYLSLGISRVWYCNLPDGRTTFSNGLICGITDGATLTGWGVPVPLTLGAAADVAGQLFPGDYIYLLTYVRLSDGQESGAADSTPVAIAAGGISLTGLPALIGHGINVYITGADSSTASYAGSTVNGSFTFNGPNSDLVLPCRTESLEPAPAGIVSALWRGRVLTAVGPVLYASKANQHELFDPRRDFKQFTADITTVVPVDGGIFVGTDTELAFLDGTEFDKLTYRQVVEGRTVLGSGIQIRGELLMGGEQKGTAMVCIADGSMVAGFSNGAVTRISEGVYSTAVTEVSATFREIDGIPQYIAVPQ